MVLTDRHGEAEVRDLIARPAEVRAYPGPAEVERGWIAPRLAPVEPNGQTLEIVFRQGVIVRGRVLEAGGRGVSHAPFTATHGSTELVSQTTDAAGAFWFAVHPQEDFPLTLEATALHVTGMGYTVTLDAPPGAEVLLRPAP